MKNVICKQYSERKEIICLSGVLMTIFCNYFLILQCHLYNKNFQERIVLFSNMYNDSKGAQLILSFPMCCLYVSQLRVAITKYHGPCGLNNIHLFPTGLEAGKFKTKLQADSVLQ